MVLKVLVIRGVSKNEKDSAVRCSCSEIDGVDGCCENGFAGQVIDTRWVVMLSSCVALWYVRRWVAVTCCAVCVGGSGFRLLTQASNEGSGRRMRLAEIEDGNQLQADAIAMNEWPATVALKECATWRDW